MYVLYICKEFFSNGRQRVLFGGATSEWIPILSGVPQESVFGSFSLHPLYQWNVWAGGEQTLCPSWWLNITGSYSQTSRQTCCAASPNRDLVSIQECCIHWCTILNPNKTTAFVVTSSRTESTPVVTWSWLGFPSALIQTLIFWCEVVVLSLLSQRIDTLMLVKRVFVDTSVLLRSYYAFVLPILEYCSSVWGSAAECHRLLLECQVYSLARLCPYRSFLSLCHWCRVTALCMLCKINLNSNYCLSVSFCQRPTRSSCCCSSSIGVWSIKLYNVRICKVFPTSPVSCVEWPSLHNVWHRNVRWV